MKIIHNLDIEKLNDDLMPIKITVKDIYDQLSGYNVNFIKYHNDFVEKNNNLPLFTKSFYNFIFTYNKIPSQEELHSYYIDNYKKNLPYVVERYTDEILYGLKARIFRLYPSLIRDLHFYLYLKENLTDCKIYYNIELDSKYGIDILIVYNIKYYGLKLCTNTKRSMDFLKEKKFRNVIVFENVIPIILPIDLDDGDNIKTLGKNIIVYNDSHLNKLKNILNMKTYKGNIEKLKSNQIFTFGSNTQGRHGKGNSLIARQKFGAIYGKSEGIQGQSFAIITKDLTKPKHPSRTKQQIIEQIEKLYKFANENSNLDFLIAYGIGINLNAYSSQEMAEMFKSLPIPKNIIFEENFYKLIINSN